MKILVIGAGHAGVEAALAVARMGIPTELITMDASRIAIMPCNPSIEDLLKASLSVRLMRWVVKWASLPIRPHCNSNY